MTATFDLDAWVAACAAAAEQTKATGAEIAAEEAAKPGIKVGDTVISWWHDRPLTWGGPSDNGSAHVSMNAGLASGTLSSTQYCDVDRVMPADAPRRAASKDPRLNVEKRPSSEKPGPWVGGNWRLITPLPDGGTYTDWCKTKTVAVERGLRRLAILDYHERLTLSD